MNKDILKYLRHYSVDPNAINRLIVSAFLHSNSIKELKNVMLNGLLIKKSDEDYISLQEFISICSISDIEELIELFEFVISPQEKVVTGAVYTPKLIREFIVKYSIDKNSVLDESFMICDPACGCSGFLLTAAKRLKELSGMSYSSIFRNNIYGLDIQNYSIQRSEILLSLVAIVEGEDCECFDFNFYVGNALDFDWCFYLENFIGFNSIVGNPPYVCSRNIDNDSKKLLMKWSVCESGHPDLYIPFFEIGISLLKPNANLGFITMNTFFKSVNGRALRKYFQTKKLEISILDFGSHQIFQSKSTYTCICFITNIKSNCLKYIRLKNSLALQFNEYFNCRDIYYNELDSENGWNLQERDVLNKIENTGTHLGEKFISRNGIATLKNDVYIFEPITENDEYYFLQNGEQFAIERDACIDIINPNKLTKTDSIELLRKKIIFPYYYENDQAKVFSEDVFSARFPNAYNYLVSKREVLAERDKGKGKNYNVWYSYGRNQSLEHYTFKLFFPHIAPSIPNFVLNDDPNLLFVNGLAIVGADKRELEYLQKVMSSRLFWFYIVNSSKPYGSGYYSFSRNYIKKFGVYDFSNEQIDFLINTKSQMQIDNFLEELYDIDLTSVLAVD